MSRNVVIVAAQRTPIGSFGGSLASLSAPALGSVAIRAALAQAKLTARPADVDEVLFGHVVQAGAGQAPARQAALGAGLPPSVICTTVNKVCASGLKAVTQGAQAIRLADANIVVAGGMESMSQAPHLVKDARFGRKYGDGSLLDALANDGLRDAFSGKSMGDFGEVCAAEENFSREQQDRYAAASFERAIKATKDGKFRGEIAPVEITKKGEKIKITNDEIKPTSYETLAKLRPSFNPPKTIHAGNASTINDGASALVLMSEAEAKKRGLEILAHIRGYADAETTPEHFPIAPSLAVPKALERAGIKLDQVDFFEFNEAFAVVALANMKRLGGIPMNKINVYGGAVCLGHPLGSSGSRILVTLLSVLKQEGGRFGVAAICNGGGGATAIVVERPTSAGAAAAAAAEAKL